MEKKKRKTGKRRRGGKKGKPQQDRPLVEVNACGIDVGARELYVAIPPDRDEEPVRVFSTFSCDLEALADWLVDKGITTVAMESTGVYWIPVYQVLEGRGVQVCLVNARHMRNVPGRRTDWNECQWLQYLHSVGLLRGAFRPEGQVCAVRSLVRHRGRQVEMASVHIRHMHKSLTQMNLQIHHVISDITGVTGMAIVDAILGGERNAAKLAELRQPEIKADAETIRKSLEGDWRSEHLFTLKQAREMYASYVRLIEECDREIEKQLKGFEPRVDLATHALPKSAKRRNNRKAKRTGDYRLDTRTEAFKLFGVDVTQIPGVDGIALNLFSEVGRDMSKWKTADYFVSWTGLCPDNDKSGGKVLWTGVRNIKNRTAQLFRAAANSLHHSPSALGVFLRRMKAKLGPEAGITATAHKLARIFYTLVKNQVEYDQTNWQQQETYRRERFEKKLKRVARQLGYQLVPIPSAG